MLSSLLYLLAFTSAATASLYWPNAETALEERSARGYAPDLSVTGATLTSKWVEGSDYVQIIEMYINNKAEVNSLTLADALNVTIVSDSLDLVRPGTLSRLYPNQSAVVQIGVQNKPGVAAGSTCSTTVVATYGESYGPTLYANQTISGICGIPQYTAEINSLGFHWTPQWYNDAKFGIFIHWGLYSAPAYGSVQPNEDYAEWYWYRQHQSDYKTKTYQYHLDTYGEDFNYDQFMSNFTDAGWDPEEWVNLFATAGAQYMVPVTKHHDGFALFDMPSNVSQRNSVQYGPKRDLIGDLWTPLSNTNHRFIEVRTYFSMPEWYNPAYAKYYAELGGPNYFGAADTNPYTGAAINYTGYTEVNDFVLGIQLPQMNLLAYKYDTEIMWCDIGGANNATIFASAWLNSARAQNRQVTFNDRCGIPGDFSTPEYTTNSDTVVSKWESNRGMDPFSFGYNYQTPDSQYLQGIDIVQSLVDIVSKNGNFLLDIGPTHNGSIPQIMQSGLTDAGSWIIPHGESIFETRFWDTTPGLGNFRYTTKPDAFYIHYLTQPPASLIIPDPVPWLPGDTVTVLGGSAAGTVVPVSRSSNGSLELTLDGSIINGDKYVWTFKLSYTSNY